ncbi:LuxR C-terminal-related transcriptional regulator [Brevundimonas vesicularis]|uniref:LuxR C-terminal-related transcriptional regulator n=1 Tax=Brevundimonas vesicularis TaxID=41276 RepID=UPI0038D380D6
MRPTPPAPTTVDALTERQRQCLTLASAGLTSSRIAAALGLSPRTVDEHLADACRLLGVRTRIQAVARLAAASPARHRPTVDLRQEGAGSMPPPRQG